MNPKVSIVVLNWNTLGWLKRCVDSIQKNTENYELIIVDNGSQEKGTKEFIDSVAHKYVFNKENKGFSGGNNDGLLLAEGKYVCFLNSDAIVSGDWLKAMVKTMENHPRCVAVGPLGNIHFNKIGGQIFEFQQYVGQYEKDTKVKSLVGFCILLKRNIIQKIGWDEDFGYGLFEDNYLSFQLIQKSHELWVSADSYVFHPHPSRSIEANNLEWGKVSKGNFDIYQKKCKQLLELKKGSVVE